MRLIIPLPYGELEFSVRKTRRARPLFWCVLLSAVLHLTVLSLIVGFLMPLAFSSVQRQPIIVSMSSALRIERRTHPQPARNATQKPPSHSSVEPSIRTDTAIATRTRPERDRPELAKKATVAPAQRNTLEAQLQRDAREFARTAEQLRAEDNPRAGLARSLAMPAAPKSYALDISGNSGKPQPEGILYPMKRWTDGAYVEYYVRYLVYYADGTTETGTVPWPIHFPLSADPFARGGRHMPLPGPPAGYVLPADASVTPLIKNCYDHRYDYCPIEREAS
jgi:hypothetical protein